MQLITILTIVSYRFGTLLYPSTYLHMKKIYTIIMMAMIAIWAMSLAHASEHDEAYHAEYNAMMEAQQEAIEATIVDWDFDAFVWAVESHQEKMETRQEEYCENYEHDEDDHEEDEDHEDNDDGEYHKMRMKCNSDYEKEEVSEEEKMKMLEEKFEYLVEYHAEHGMLPQKEDMHKPMWMKKEMGEMREERKDMMKEHRKDRKHFKQEHRGLVKKALWSASKERLMTLVQKIDMMLSQVDDEKTVDILWGIKEVVEEVLAE